MKAKIVKTALQPAGPVSFRGFVDVMDRARGVRGWALDLAAPGVPTPVELLVGTTVVATTTPSLPRHDISESLGVPVVAGFFFEPSVLRKAGELAKSGDDPIVARIAGTRHRLGMSGTVFVRDVADEIGSAKALEREPPRQLEFGVLVEELRGKAASLALQPLRALPENLQGYIETICADSAGQIWFAGWMHRGHGLEFAAVINDGEKVPAAAIVMTFERDDLPPDGCGIIGLLAASWKPSGRTRDLSVFFGEAGKFFLRAHSPLRISTASEFVSDYETMRDKVRPGGRAEDLQRLLSGLESWLPTRGSPQAHGTEVSIDRVLMIPGLGCFVEGWVMSPLKRVEGLRLRVGGAVMTARPDATFWKPRMDITQAFPNSEALARRAGFVGFFASEVEPEDFSDPMLKILFQGGASANWPLDSRIFRKLGYSATLDDALRFFPALQEETFFPRFAEAAVRAERGAMSPPIRISVARTRKVLIFVLPEDRCDLFYLFEDVAQQCRRSPGLASVAFIAASKSNRSDALWLFKEFQANHSVPSSLLVIDEAAHAFDLLGDILRELAANRFVFVGPGIFLTEEGWARAREVLSDTSPDLVFLGMEPDPWDAAEEGGAPSARCFAWTTRQFLRWSANMPSFLGGFHLDNLLIQSEGKQSTCERAARASRSAVPDRLHAAINAEIYGSGVRL